MRIIFFGSVTFSKFCLEKIINDNYNVVGICTLKESNFNSDFLDLSPIAKEFKIPSIYEDFSDPNTTIDWLKKLKPDIIFCIGWSRLLKNDVLKIPTIGVIGYHPALLPLNRGRHPIIWALNLGLKRTGSTFFFMNEKADSGPIISQKIIDIEENDNASSLYNKLINKAKYQISEFLPLIKKGKLIAIKQNELESNYWRKRSFKDGIIDWRMSSSVIRNLIRSLTKPYSGAAFLNEEKYYTVWQSELVNCDIENIEPGKIINVLEENIYVIKCGSGAIKIYNIEPDIKLIKGDYI